MGRNKRKHKSHSNSKNDQNNVKTEMFDPTDRDISVVAHPLHAHSNEFRKKNMLCDIKIRADGKEFPGHRIMLASFSKYFEKKFQERPGESVLDVPGISAEIMEKLIDFIYEEFLLINDENVYQLLEGAAFLVIAEAVKYCFRYLTKHNVLNACVPAYMMAIKYHHAKYCAAAQQYIIQNFDEATKEPKFYELDKEDIVVFLQSEDLVVSSEEVVYKAMVQWLKTDLPGRIRHLREILELVRFPQLSMKFLRDHVKNEEIIIQSTIGQFLHHEAIDHHIKNDTL